jgi:MFS family permease
MPEWLRQVQTFGIFAAGYLARPLGGIIMAHFGDKVGRKKMFSLSILLMALPTLAMGMLPTYQSIGIAAPLLLLLMRVLQGAAIGGEVPGAWVFVAEHVPRKRVGFACGTLTAGLTAGILLGSLVATLLNTVMSQESILAGGWRIPFFLGGIFGLFAMYLRRWLQETPIFVEMQARKALAEEMPLKTVVKNHRKEGRHFYAAHMVAFGWHCGGDSHDANLSAKTVWYLTGVGFTGKLFGDNCADDGMRDCRSCDRSLWCEQNVYRR